MKNSNFFDKRYVMKHFLIAAVIILLMAGCSFHPLGIPDEEWEQMTIEQRHDAYIKQQELTRKRLELEEQEKEIENQKLALERQQNGITAYSDEMLRLNGGIIGGEFYGDREQLVISLGRFVWVDRIDFYAHDNVNRHCNGRLNIQVDHYNIVSNLDIKKRGKKYSYYIGRYCRNIVFEAASMDEVSISDIEIFGTRMKTIHGIRVYID